MPSPICSWYSYCRTGTPDGYAVLDRFVFDQLGGVPKTRFTEVLRISGERRNRDVFFFENRVGVEAAILIEGDLVQPPFPIIIIISSRRPTDVCPYDVARHVR